MTDQPYEHTVRVDLSFESDVENFDEFVSQLIDVLRDLDLHFAEHFPSDTLCFDSYVHSEPPEPLPPINLCAYCAHTVSHHDPVDGPMGPVCLVCACERFQKIDLP